MKGFKVFSAEDDVTKAQTVERFNRILKGKLYKLWSTTETTSGYLIWKLSLKVTTKPPTHQQVWPPTTSCGK